MYDVIYNTYNILYKINLNNFFSFVLLWQAKTRIGDVLRLVCSRLELQGMRDSELFGLALEIGKENL